MAISAQDVKQLREATGAGMMDCKKALVEADGDFDQAIDILRKKGQKVAASRSDRDATEGAIVTATTDSGDVGVIVEVNSETDFVARNDQFVTFAQKVADALLDARPADLDAAQAVPVDGQPLGEALTAMTGKIGEKIDVRRFETVEAQDGGTVVDYIHPGAKLGVLVEMTGSGDLAEAGRDVAMQAAAMNPVAATRADVSQETQDKEREIGREQARAEGKPDQILDKIAEGKLTRYFKDNVLVEQPFVKDSSMTVEQMLKKQDAELRRFVRFALGG
ncbi:translation elongation factor Ts [Rubrivirga sp. S365]|uniref:Elongation factor Ts n=1 Tax=Rubrivirga litoralis TaxID=3075598 RepID=A0ABU3BQG5_9BACT|nr:MULTISPECIES: translation elongation factor Ts [unclassified Rubrivirga]MDT0631528.1 translation elongation factor Ts [Rubrivirga sp. F394]MDT7855489.1 translation elongation factor Ts [Rubrivirga sp. S365]